MKKKILGITIAIVMLFATIGLVGCNRVTTVFAWYEGSTEYDNMPIVMNAGDTFTVTRSHFEHLDIEFERFELNLHFSRGGNESNPVVTIQGDTITAGHSGHAVVAATLIEEQKGSTIRHWGVYAIIIHVINEDSMTHITTAQELQGMSLDGHYILMSDIDLVGIDWLPIGSISNFFTGMLVNPHQFVVSNLTIASHEKLVPSATGSFHGGLFGAIDLAFIYGLILENVYINISDSYRFLGTGGGAGISSAGGIAAHIWHRSFVINNSVQGYVSARNVVGGIAAYSGGLNRLSGNEFEGTVKQQSAVEDRDTHGAGGIVGFTILHLAGTTFQPLHTGIFNSRVNATIVATRYAGGIIGHNTNVGVPINWTFEGTLSGGRDQGEMIGFSPWQHLWE